MWSHRKFSLVVGSLSLVGLALSSVSLYHHTQTRYGLKQGASFCNINEAFNCDAVNESAWSMLFGIPLASYGIGFYLILALFSLILASPRIVDLRAARNALLVPTTLASVFSLFLFYISEFVIGTICLVCVGMYLVNFGLFAASLRADHPSRLFASLGAGFRTLVSFFLSAFGARSSGARGPEARTALGVAAVAILIAAMASDSLFLRLLVEAQHEAQESRSAQGAVKLWEGQAAVKFPFDTDALEGPEHILGPADAPIEVVEFSDFQCPACRNFHRSLEELLGEYSGKIRLVHKNYPLDPSCNLSIQSAGHVGACYMANASECASEQGKYWEMVSALFEIPLRTPVELDGVREQVQGLVRSLGLDFEGFNECVTAPRTIARITSDLSHGNALGLRATPTVWVNGKQVQIPTKEVLRTIFDHLVSKHAA